MAKQLVLPRLALSGLFVTLSDRCHHHLALKEADLESNELRSRNVYELFQIIPLAEIWLIQTLLSKHRTFLKHPSQAGTYVCKAHIPKIASYRSSHAGPPQIAFMKNRVVRQHRSFGSYKPQGSPFGVAHKYSFAIVTTECSMKIR